jgi:peptidoglycan hydrolase CwlO-like protein
MSKIVQWIEIFTKGIGSITSVIIHTILFAIILIVGALQIVPWDTVLLVLTTAVSLEAIYLAIFIQMSVNQNTQSLKAVEEDVDEIQEDVEEIQEDVDEIQKDVDEIQEDVDEIQEDVVEIQEGDVEDEYRDLQQQRALEGISQRLHRLLEDFDKLKKP